MRKALQQVNLCKGCEMEAWQAALSGALDCSASKSLNVSILLISRMTCLLLRQFRPNAPPTFWAHLLAGYCAIAGRLKCGHVLNRNLAHTGADLIQVRRRQINKARQDNLLAADRLYCLPCQFAVFHSGL